MKAAILYGPRDFRVEQVETPELGDRGVLIQVKVCGICPSDVRTYTGDKANVTYPQRPGHEWVGEVLDTGPAASCFKAGDRVGAFVQVVCGMCQNCQRDLSNLCLARRSPDGDERLPSTRPGGYAEIGWAVPEALEHIPAGMPFEVAVFAEPLACCLNGINRTPISPGATVAIIGLGPIGLLLSQLTLLRGAKVIGLDLIPERLALAKELGVAEALLASEPGIAERVFDLTAGCGVEAAIVAVGSPQAELLAFDIVGEGGCVNFFAGTYPSTTVSVDPNVIHYKQLWVTGSYHFTPDGFRAALKLLDRGAVRVTPLVSHRLPLASVAEGFEIVANRRGRKVLICMDENSELST
jgi:L-iditol 2-dehydrogenase